MNGFGLVTLVWILCGDVAEAGVFCCVLQEQRQLTHENVQRKQARTGEERDEEDEEPSESESEDEDNEIIYNPKNLPLGWDGKVCLILF